MEDALSSATLPFRRNEFSTYILETRVPGVHFNVDDDVGSFPVSEEEKFTGDETGDVVVDGISHSQCLQFLYKRGPNFLMKNLKDRETICSVLLTMADNVKVLPPANEPLPTDLLNMTSWKVSLRELVGEMKTVEESFPSLIANSGVYVLTSSPFAAFLRALAAEIADVRS